MNERIEGQHFKFDPRLEIPQAPEGQVVVKFFGQPVFVSEPHPGEQPIAGGLFPSQLSELIAMQQETGIGACKAKKVASGQGKLL